MTFYMIRFKNATDPEHAYSPRGNITYHIVPNQILDYNVKREHSKFLPYDYAHSGLVSESRAGVYPSEKSLRAVIRVLITHGKQYMTNCGIPANAVPDFSYYEVVKVDNGKVTTHSFDEFLKK